MRIVLAHPPLDDPTLPYHSTAYLAGHLAHRGFEQVGIRDTNIEFVHWLHEPEVVDALYAEADRRLAELSGKGGLRFQEAEEYFGLWSQPRLSHAELRAALETMREAERFLDYEGYKESVANLLRYQGFLGALSFPAEVSNFRQSTRGRFSSYNLRDLFDEGLARRICDPFDRFLECRIAGDREFAAADCVGISIVYDHQLFHALHMARWLKRRWPEKTVLFGGTSISQLYKYLRDKGEMRRFFSCCDGIVVGEGETAICQIAEAGGVVPGADVRNLISYDAARDRLFLPPFVHYENVPELGRPLYRYPWELYLSPERGINYSPTRGCYWNRCTFCDYGLNTSKPTSPWRERRVEQVIDDLRAAREETGARNVYFAVDVMSPAYLDKLSDALLESDLDLRWSAELRLERVFSAERCRKMAESGCVCVSFGMESGSQRILDLIDKGTKVVHMGDTMRNFAEAGIACQLMAFSDFPTETREEKEETRRFVEEFQDSWSAGGMGTFLLTGTAIVAKHPDRFGVRLVETEDADVVRALTYEVESDGRDDESRAMLTEDRDASFDKDGGVFPLVLGRPWAGGTDTLHTMLYYGRYGRRFFRDHPIERPGSPGPEAEGDLLACRLFLPGLALEASYDVGEIVGLRRSFSDELKRLSRIPREPTRRSYEEWAAALPDQRPDPRGTSYWIRAEQKCVPLDKMVYRLLRAAVAAETTLGELVSPFGEPLRSRLLAFFRDLGRHGLVEFNPPRRARRETLEAGGGYLPAGGAEGGSRPGSAAAPF